ncbi:MAG: HAD family phosphatase [Chitinophagaceae bacterium]
MKKLVIFDIDGVLLDSEKVYLDINQAWFKEIGIKLSVEKHQTFIGSSAKRFWQYLKEENNLDGEIDTYIELEKELKNKALREQDLLPTEHVIDFLDFLEKNGNIIGIASSGLKKNIDLILTKLNIGHYFDLVVSGEQVIKGKPEPDIFLKVADHFNYQPADCIVIEDSTNGVTAAKAAGMFCVGFYNPNSGNQDLSKADLIIDSFKDQRLFAIAETL